MRKAAEPAVRWSTVGQASRLGSVVQGALHLVQRLRMGLEQALQRGMARCTLEQIFEVHDRRKRPRALPTSATARERFLFSSRVSTATV